VFRAREKQTGDIVALKKLKLDEEKYGFPLPPARNKRTYGVRTRQRRWHP